jgi:hypothetical protein
MTVAVAGVFHRHLPLMEHCPAWAGRSGVEGFASAKPKLSPEQIGPARKLIDDGERREDVAELLNLNRTAPFTGRLPEQLLAHES